MHGSTSCTPDARAALQPSVSKAAVGGVLGNREHLAREMAMCGGPLAASGKEIQLLAKDKAGAHFTSVLGEMISAQYGGVTVRHVAPRPHRHATFPGRAPRHLVIWACRASRGRSSGFG